MDEGLRDVTDCGTERRSSRRYATTLKMAKLHSRAGTELCVLKNVSDAGCKARLYRKIIVGEAVSLEIPGNKAVDAQVVWASGWDVGLRFDDKVDLVAALAAPEEVPSPFGGRAPRVAIEVRALLQTQGRYYNGQVVDISQAGLKLKVDHKVICFDPAVINLPGLPPLGGHIRWVKDGCVGMQFDDAISFEALANWIAAADGVLAQAKRAEVN